jgi:hypothetical protein
MSILSGWKVYAAGALVLASAYAGHQVTAWQKDAKYNAMVATHAQVMQDYSDRASKAETAQREEETRRDTERQRIENETRIQIEKSRAAAVAAGLERDRLRAALSTYTASRRSASPNPSIDASGQTLAGDDPLDMLSGMLTRHTGELAEVGRYADEIRDKAIGIEGKYDSLTP